MIATDVKEQIRKILGEGAGVNLYFALKQENNEIVVKRADLEDGDTQAHLKAQFISLLQEDFLHDKELEIQDVSKADERNTMLYRYDMAEFPESLKYFSDFDYQKEYDMFSFKKDDLIRLDAYLIVIGTQENYCILYKKFYSVFLIGRGSFCLLPAKNRFEEFGKEILRVSRDYQIIRLQGEIYVKSLKVLEKFGGFRQIIENEAEAAVQMIEDIGLLEESEGLRDWLKQDISFARKLSKIKNTSPVLSSNIPNNMIISFSKTYLGLAGQLKYNSQGDKILLTTKKSQDIFLKLLDDSFLISQLTNLYYDSRAKEKIVI